jgi:hypothetical protein
MSSTINLITGTSTGFCNISSKPITKNGPTVDAHRPYTNRKKKAQKNTLSDLAKSHQVKLKINKSEIINN